MKKITLTLLSVLFPVISLAQNFEFEVIRTEESPGFFAVRLFPPQGLSPIEIHDIFVQNITQHEGAYTELISTLQSWGLTVVEKEQIPEYIQDKNVRIIVLGKAIDGFLNFHIEDPQYVSQEFEKFALEHLGPVFFQDIRFQFGGNISEVIPTQITYWGGQELLLVGKFEKPMRTYAEIIGVSSEGEVLASAILDLRTFYNTPLAYELGDLWEQRLQGDTEENYDLFWLSAFSWILGGGGFLLLAFVLLTQIKKKRTRDSLFDHYDTRDLEEELPFDIDRRETKKVN